MDALGRTLRGNFYALVEGLPGCSKALRTKSWKSVDLCVAHVGELSSQHPDIKVVSYYQVVGNHANEKRDRAIVP